MSQQARPLPARQEPLPPRNQLPPFPRDHSQGAKRMSDGCSVHIAKHDAFSYAGFHLAEPAGIWDVMWDLGRVYFCFCEVGGASEAFWRGSRGV